METVDFLGILLQLILVGFLQCSNLLLQFVHQLVLYRPQNTVITYNAELVNSSSDLNIRHNYLTTVHLPQQLWSTLNSVLDNELCAANM